MRGDDSVNVNEVSKMRPKPKSGESMYMATLLRLRLSHDKRTHSLLIVLETMPLYTIGSTGAWYGNVGTVRLGDKRWWKYRCSRWTGTARRRWAGHRHRHVARIQLRLCHQSGSRSRT
jgi:hypothetical protein